ncbi:hypothetical protein TrVGV298_002139 [Trichoderma virens]|uniref:Secreted protein n=1 Tax=Hypocrea virens (strain Gv29-8 / FGSC 10586) TaxID=413071 RepID=G9MRY3_HYPVG|nr:hypothetical protein TRIVIDRAFT_60325 [Trichoderma virens Gv29-8]UKZ47905.1 hypothetical protein TrVGV298_002139 [Trichoderma virens]
MLPIRALRGLLPAALALLIRNLDGASRLTVPGICLLASAFARVESVRRVGIGNSLRINEGGRLVLHSSPSPARDFKESLTPLSSADAKSCNTLQRTVLGPEKNKLPDTMCLAFAGLFVTILARSASTGKFELNSLNSWARSLHFFAHHSPLLVSLTCMQISTSFSHLAGPFPAVFYKPLYTAGEHVKRHSYGLPEHNAEIDDAPGGRRYMDAEATRCRDPGSDKAPLNTGRRRIGKEQKNR